MVTMDKVQKGLAAFIDREMMPVLSGWDKVIVGGGASVVLAKLPKLISQYPIISALDLYDKETNQLDVDTLYQAVIPYIGAEPLPAKIPVLNMTVKIGRPEVDALYQYVKEA